MRRRCLLALAVGIFLSYEAQAVTYDFLSFFLSPPGACTAVSKTNTGSYFRIYEYSPCGGYRRFVFAKGKSIWSTESFVLRDAYVRNMAELSYSGGQITGYRAFRDLSTGEKGMPWSVRFFDDSAFWTMPPYNNEHWTNDQGVPVCLNTMDTEETGPLDWMQVEYIGTLRNFVRDQRSTSPDPTSWHDIEAILLTQHWGTVIEHFMYGRWTNPWTHAVESLGLVQVDSLDNGVQQDLTKFNTLVDCSMQVTCSTCPP